MEIIRKTLPIILIFVLCGLVFGQNDTTKPQGNAGLILGKAISLPKPSSWTSCNCKFSGLINNITVHITIDENGSVINATSFSGHPVLRANSEAAARNSKFAPTFLVGKPQIMLGELVYTFDIEKSEVSVRDSPLKFEKIPLGNLNDRAISLPLPKYYSTCAKATGSLNVQVKINLQTGNVIEAKAVSGHPIYRKLVEDAALQAKFDFTKNNFPAKFGTGVLTYKVEDFIGYREEMLVETTPVNLEIINKRATFLPKPIYPHKAKDFCAKGKVEVEVLVDESGNVIEAKAISGDDLLRESAVEAVKKAKFSSNHNKVKTQGIIIYNFDSLAPKCLVTNRIVNKKAIYLPKPILTNIIHQKHLQLKNDEIVKVEIIIDETGKVTSARAISGHVLLRSACENAARKANFSSLNDVGRIRVKAFLIYKIKPNGEVETMNK